MTTFMIIVGALVMLGAFVPARRGYPQLAVLTGGFGLVLFIGAFVSGAALFTALIVLALGLVAIYMAAFSGNVRRNSMGAALLACVLALSTLAFWPSSNTNATRALSEVPVVSGAEGSAPLSGADAVTFETPATIECSSESLRSWTELITCVNELPANKREAYISYVNRADEFGTWQDVLRYAQLEETTSGDLRVITVFNSSDMPEADARNAVRPDVGTSADVLPVVHANEGSLLNTRGDGQGSFEEFLDNRPQVRTMLVPPVENANTSIALVAASSAMVADTSYAQRGVGVLTECSNPSRGIVKHVPATPDAPHDTPSSTPATPEQHEPVEHETPPTTPENPEPPCEDKPGLPCKPEEETPEEPCVDQPGKPCNPEPPCTTDCEPTPPCEGKDCNPTPPPVECETDCEPTPPCEYNCSPEPPCTTDCEPTPPPTTCEDDPSKCEEDDDAKDPTQGPEQPEHHDPVDAPDPNQGEDTAPIEDNPANPDTKPGDEVPSDSDVTAPDVDTDENNTPVIRDEETVPDPEPEAPTGDDTGTEISDPDGGSSQQENNSSGESNTEQQDSASGSSEESDDSSSSSDHVSTDNDAPSSSQGESEPPTVEVELASMSSDDGGEITNLAIALSMGMALGVALMLRRRVRQS